MRIPCAHIAHGYTTNIVGAMHYKGSANGKCTYVYMKYVEFILLDQFKITSLAVLSIKCVLCALLHIFYLRIYPITTSIFAFIKKIYILFAHILCW